MTRRRSIWSDIAAPRRPGPDRFNPALCTPRSTARVSTSTPNTSTPGPSATASPTRSVSAIPADTADSDSSSDGEIDDSDPPDYVGCPIPYYPTLPPPPATDTFLPPTHPYVQVMRGYHDAQRQWTRAYYERHPRERAELLRHQQPAGASSGPDPEADHYDEYGRQTPETWDRHASEGFHVDRRGKTTSVFYLRRSAPPYWAVEEHERLLAEIDRLQERFGGPEQPRLVGCRPVLAMPGCQLYPASRSERPDGRVTAYSADGRGERRSEYGQR